MEESPFSPKKIENEGGIDHFKTEIESADERVNLATEGLQDAFQNLLSLSESQSKNMTADFLLGITPYIAAGNQIAAIEPTEDGGIMIITLGALPDDK